MTVNLAVIGANGRVGRLLRGAAVHLPGRTRRFWGGRGSDAGMAHNTFRWTPDEGIDGLAKMAEEGGAPPILFMLAGVTTGSETELAVNSRLAVACLDAARSLGVNRVLLASSSAVYGYPGPDPIREDTTPHEPNAYGRAKLAMETAAEAYREVGIDICCLRIGNVGGADSVTRAAATASEAQPILLDRFADGEGPRRSYIGASTLLRVVEDLALAPSCLPATLNVAAPSPIGMAALMRAAGVPWHWRPAPATARQSIVLDIAGLEQYCQFTAPDSDPTTILRQAFLSSKIPHDPF